MTFNSRLTFIFDFRPAWASCCFFNCCAFFWISPISFSFSYRKTSVASSYYLTYLFLMYHWGITVFLVYQICGREVDKTDQYQYLGYRPPTPPLTQQQSIENNLRLMLGWGRGGWAVAQILILIRQDNKNKRLVEAHTSAIMLWFSWRAFLSSSSLACSNLILSSALCSLPSSPSSSISSVSPFSFCLLLLTFLDPAPPPPRFSSSLFNLQTNQTTWKEQCYLQKETAWIFISLQMRYWPCARLKWLDIYVWIHWPSAK